MQGKIKKLIIFLSIILIIIFIVLIFMLKKSNNTQGDVVQIKEFEKESPKGNQIVYEQTNEFYYSVKDIITEYYTQIANMYATNRDIYEIFSIEEGIEVEEGEIIRLKEYVKKNAEKAKSEVYYRLGTEYIKENDITVENIDTKIRDVNFENLVVEEMLVTNELDGIYTYFVKGNVIIKDSNETQQFQLMVIVDRAKRCYSIYPQEYLEIHNYNNIQHGGNLEVFENQTGIEKNEYNTFSIIAISTETKAQDLLEDLRMVMEYTPNEAINRIDTEYYNIRFDNETEALEYIKKKAKAMRVCFLETYSMEEVDGCKIYTCEDTKGNYYVFKEIAPFKYSVILDNYTVATTDFTSQYNQSTEKEKVVLNIKKFFMSINDKNYGYSYSVLSDTFKNNKYPTKNEFISYVEQNFFEENEVKYISYEKENGVYIYKIKILDATGKDSTEKDFNIIVKLNSGTNFEMSFGTN